MTKKMLSTPTRTVQITLYCGNFFRCLPIAHRAGLIFRCMSSTLEIMTPFLFGQTKDFPTSILQILHSLVSSRIGFVSDQHIYRRKRIKFYRHGSRIGPRPFVLGAIHIWKGSNKRRESKTCGWIDRVDAMKDVQWLTDIVTILWPRQTSHTPGTTFNVFRSYQAIILLQYSWFERCWCAVMICKWKLPPWTVKETLVWRASESPPQRFRFWCCHLSQLPTARS